MTGATDPSSEGGDEGEGPGQFRTPLTIAKDGSIWIADGSNHRIQNVDSDGSFKVAFGRFGEGSAGTLNVPSQVAFDDAGRGDARAVRTGSIRSGRSTCDAIGAERLRSSAATDGYGVSGALRRARILARSRVS